MVRYGFGERTGESEKGGLPQFEHGHLEVSNKAFKYASSQYPQEPPAGAIGLALADVGGVDLSDYADTPAPDVDLDDVRESVQSVDGVGEETAEAVVNALQGAL